jgi:phytoene synthase
MIEARRFDLYDDPMPSLNDLEGYLGETSAMTMHLVARVLAGEEALALSGVTGTAGVAYGITHLMRSLAEHRARGQCFVPVDLLEKCDISPAHLLAGRDNHGVDVVLSQLRQQAEVRLAEARHHMSAVSAAALAALWPASVCDLYLRKMARAGAGILQRPVEVSQLRRQARLLKMSLTEAY